MTKGITNIGKYRIISVGKRIENGEFWSLRFLRDGIKYNYFINGQYKGKIPFSDVYYLLRTAYNNGYKTLAKS